MALLFSIYPFLSLLGGDFSLRGVWFQAVDIRTRAKADETIRRLSNANLNAVFPLVYFWGGKAYFKSSYAPLAEGVEEGFDPLSYFIEECHKRGIKVHPRFVIGEEGSGGGNGILLRRKEWQIENALGERQRWYDIGKRAVRDFYLGLILEMVRNYDVDGVQLDYIRYPSSDYCYCEECRKGFREKFDHDPLELVSSLPAYLFVSSNPLIHPTTAKVLAVFENEIPAITLNRYREGHALLFNWHLENNLTPLASELVRRAVRWRSKTYLLRSETNARESGNGGYERMAKLLSLAGVAFEPVEETRIEALEPSQSVLILPCVYSISGEAMAQLERFVAQGGRVIFVDGPIKSIDNERLKRILGMEGKGEFFARSLTIIPLISHHLLPLSERGWKEVKEMGEKWEEYRKGLVTEFVRELREAVKRVKGDVMLSSAVYYRKSSADGVLQDWYGWLEEGIVDFVAPMAYVSDEELERALQEWKSADPLLERIVPGLSIYKVRQGKEVPKAREEVSRQLGLIKRGEAKGFILFSLPFLTDEIASLLRASGGEF